MKMKLKIKISKIEKVNNYSFEGVLLQCQGN